MLASRSSFPHLMKTRTRVIEKSAVKTTEKKRKTSFEKTPYPSVSSPPQRQIATIAAKSSGRLTKREISQFSAFTCADSSRIRKGSLNPFCSGSKIASIELGEEASLVGCAEEEGSSGGCAENVAFFVFAFC